jgi:hypothetical protein
MVVGQPLPSRGEDRIDVGLRHAVGALGQFRREIQHGPHLRRYVGLGIAGQQRGNRPLGNTQTLGGRGVHAVAIPATVQSGHVGGDQLALGFNERRRAAQQSLVKLEQWTVRLRKRLEDVKQRRLFRQRRKVGHARSFRPIP